MSRFGVFCTALAAAAMVSFVPPAFSAGAGASTQIAQMSPEMPAYSELELRIFAEAAKDVFEIHQKYQPRFEATSSDEERQEIITAAETETRKAIEGKGMTVELYDEILFAARTDPELGMRVQALLDQQ